MKITENPDKNIVSSVRAALKESGGYCPCSLVKNADTKCMCKEFRNMTNGMCHCGLYINSN